MSQQNSFNLPIRGKCQCGQVTFSISKEPLTFYACHCTECQSQSSSAFGLSLWVAKTAFSVSGNTHIWTRKTDSGGQLHCHFCPDCGTRLWHESSKKDPDHGAILSIKGGAIDALRKVAPIGHIWTGSKHAATLIPENVLAFTDGNIDHQALIRAWENR